MTESPEPSPTENLDRQIQDLRRELVTAELEIIELNDRLISKETDRADAVALLGRAELVLEEKIGYIVTLDHALSARIRELETECEEKKAEIDRREKVIKRANATDERNRAERDAIIVELSERLESANQATSKAHELARDFAAKLDATQQKLKQTTLELVTSESKCGQVAAELEITHDRTNELTTKLSAERDKINKLQNSLQASENARTQTKASLTESEKKVATITSSLLWRLSGPWRYFFGPEI
ncbi:hypothetical protein [Synoicihabitans lomoniglobus]|uniref:Uncharacterized protein n=1 Tax=Synoicihabitans lomoniglobus TaxID=2909285 RepID=A0AAF0I5I6_9BACT|nr:hypothetical protein [Opitutaceae bacterium LMO-M01]WED67378.1 hypothetical protein PXH66_11010 [Opitutaceae bacterium LMO-M01]